MYRLKFEFMLIMVWMSLFNCKNSEDLNFEIETLKLVGVDHKYERIGDSIFLYVPHETDVTN